MKKIISLATLLFIPTILWPATPPPPETLKHFWNIAETIHKVQTQSFRQVDIGALVEAGLKAMANKIDAHSSFFTPKSYQTTIDLTAGQFPGIGVSIMFKPVDEEALLIIEAIPGGPAAIGELKNGDKIINIDGQKLRGLTFEESAALLKGKIGSTVNLKVMRDKTPLEFTLTRTLITNRSVLSYYFPTQKVAYIALKDFSDKTASRVRDLLSAAHERHAQSIILDVRRNPGGVLDAAIDTCSLFLPDHSLVATTKNNRGSVVQSYYTSGTPTHQAGCPLFIITDNFTASSSEVLTGCLQHYAHTSSDSAPVFICGMPTFGKGSVQEIMPLSNGCALKLTTMLYYLPNSECLQARGITPDFIIKPKTVPKDQLKWVEELYGKETAQTGHITRAEVENPENGYRVEPGTTTNRHPDTGSESGTTDPVSIKKTKPTNRELEASFQESLTSDHCIHQCLTMSNLYHLAKQYMPEKVDTFAHALDYLKQTVVSDEPPAVEPL